MFVVLLALVIFASANAKEIFSCSVLDCSHECNEEKLVPKCVCPSDMILGADSKTCEFSASLLLLTNRGLKIFKEGQSDDELNLALNVRSYAFDYYFSKKEIYAYVGDEIKRYTFADSNLSGKPLSTSSVVEVDTRVTSLAVDWVHSQLYWVCRQRSLIETSGTDGSNRKEVASYSPEEDSSGSWADIAVDPYTEKLFWLGPKGLYVSDLKGQYNITTLKNLHPEHITVDIHNQLVYVVGGSELGGKVAVRCRYDGSVVGEEVSLGQDGSTVSSIGAFGNKLYWQSNYLGENIYKTNIVNVSSGKKANADVTLVTELYEVILSFKIYHPKIQQQPKTIK